MRIKVNDWYDIHKGFTLNLTPGVTCLVGPNGAGKTTLLRQIKEYADRHAISVWEYSNYRDARYEDDRYMESGDSRMFVTAMTSSEGERVAIHLSGRMSSLGKAVRDASQSKKPLVVLLDALDSGASIDRTRDLSALLNTLREDTAGLEVYIVVAVNQYELVKKPTRCVDCRTGREVEFDSYEDYAEFICTYFERNGR